jgi:hypothetical protein
MSEMQDGEDVEILFGWYDINGNRHGGHWITVTGIIQVGEFKGITFKDDENQSDSTGTRHKFVQWDDQGEWGRLIGFDGPNSYCWVESVVSESYDSTVVFTGILEPDPTEPISFVVYRNPSLRGEEIWLRFRLEEPVEVEVRIYSMRGELLGIVFKGQLNSGNQEIPIREHQFGSSGTYLVVLRAGNKRGIMKVLRM